MNQIKVILLLSLVSLSFNNVLSLQDETIQSQNVQFNVLGHQLCRGALSSLKLDYEFSQHKNQYKFSLSVVYYRTFR